jgi:hypothetical protein
MRRPRVPELVEASCLTSSRKVSSSDLTGALSPRFVIEPIVAHFDFLQFEWWTVELVDLHYQYARDRRQK